MQRAARGTVPMATPPHPARTPRLPALNMAAAPSSRCSAHALKRRGGACCSALRSSSSYWALAPANGQRLLPGGGGGAWRAEGATRQSARGVAGAKGGAALEPGAPRRRCRRHRPRLPLSPPARPGPARGAPHGRQPRRAAARCRSGWGRLWALSRPPPRCPHVGSAEEGPRGADRADEGRLPAAPPPPRPAPARRRGQKDGGEVLEADGQGGPGRGVARRGSAGWAGPGGRGGGVGRYGAKLCGAALLSEGMGPHCCVPEG